MKAFMIMKRSDKLVAHTKDLSVFCEFGDEYRTPYLFSEHDINRLIRANLIPSRYYKVIGVEVKLIKK